MLKSVLTSAIIIALSLGISYSTTAQPKAVKVDTKTEAVSVKVDPAKSVSNVDRTKNRVDMQLQRYIKDYKLSEQQQKDFTTILNDFENQSNDLRTKLNALNKEKNEKIESLLTDDQKKMKEQALKERRDRLIEKRNEVQKDATKAVPAPSN